MKRPRSQDAALVWGLVVFLIVQASLSLGAQGAKPVKAVLERFLADPAVRRGAVGVCVIDLSSGRVLAQADPNTSLIPASNMKILTVLAALEFLGETHEFRSRMIAAGTIENGTLTGDLVLAGDGDASFGLPGEDGVDAWAGAVRDAGIRVITGDLVVVESCLDRTYAHPDWIERYAAADNTALNVAALGLGENKVEIRVRGAARIGARARVTVVPDCGHVTIDNRTRTVARGRVGPGSKRAWGSNAITVSAKVPVGKRITGTAAVHDPPLFLARALRVALVARGVTLRGTIRRADREPSGRVLAAHGTSIGWMIEHALKKSDNRVTEILYKAAGQAFARTTNEGDAQRSGTSIGGTFASGARAVAEIIRRARVETESAMKAPPVASGDAPRGAASGVAQPRAREADDGSSTTGAGREAGRGAIVLRDGSGLSRHNRLTAETITAVLQWAFTRPHYTMFARSLARGAEPGSTLRKRFRNTAVASHLRAKTGYLYNVRALSGYLRVGRDRVIVFSVLMNDLSRTSPKARKALDWFVAALWRAAAPKQ